MVKITNKLGDIKTGRQGEAVYQRRYGEQIRRTAQPKRAIASKAQLEHRDLYRDALAWRKGLSLANRRYLDGYCIANGIVDDYKIPLAWHKFALKLYLEKVKFVVIEKASFSEDITYGKDEAYDNTSEKDVELTAYGARWMGQTFTPDSDLELDKIQTYIYHQGAGGDVTFHIRATDAEGLPTGEDLVSKVVSGWDIPTSIQWFTTTLPAINLTAGKQYALLISYSVDNYTLRIKWGADRTAPTYTKGTAVTSSNSGSTWTIQADRDALFRTYGTKTKIESVSGLIHVRHPALLAVVQKRGEKTITEYQNLSSLDDEYLTTQVGLDVEIGDIIDATTIAGINYRYQVV